MFFLGFDTPRSKFRGRPSLNWDDRGVLSEDPPDAPRAAVIVLRLCKLLALGVDEPDGGAGDSRLSDDFDGFIDKFKGASS